MKTHSHANYIAIKDVGGGFMSLISKILHGWHYVRMNYHHVLVDSCINDKFRNELRSKLEYHKNKVEHFKRASI